jgi:curved DNA-binding protein CbpA
MENYYNILGVDRSANQAQIKSAYRRLARIHHPDTNNGSKDAEATFKKIGEAYECLSDTAKRRDYDERIKRPNPPPNARPQQPSPSYRSERSSETAGMRNLRIREACATEKMRARDAYAQDCWRIRETQARNTSKERDACAERIAHARSVYENAVRLAQISRDSSIKQAMDRRDQNIRSIGDFMSKYLDEARSNMEQKLASADRRAAEAINK